MKNNGKKQRNNGIFTHNRFVERKQICREQLGHILDSFLYYRELGNILMTWLSCHKRPITINYYSISVEKGQEILWRYKSTGIKEYIKLACFAEK